AFLVGAVFAQAAKVDFEHEVVPLLVKRCIACHGPEEDKGDLRLDLRERVFPAGEEDAWTIVAGKADASELVRRVELPLGDDDIMPAKGDPLTKEQQQLLRRWVEEGAVWPETGDALLAAAIAAQQVPKITFDLPAADA